MILFMKQFLSFLLLLFSHCILSAQSILPGTLLQTNDKFRLLYVDMREDSAYVYEIGRFIEKAGVGPSIHSIDSMSSQTAGNYSGRLGKIFKEGDAYFIERKFKKTKKMSLDTVRSRTKLNLDLNNAWFLGRYFDLCREIEKAYPMCSFPYWNAFQRWKDFPVKEMEYLPFREFAGNYFKKLKDSVSIVQTAHVTLTNYLVANLDKLGYTRLRDSLVVLLRDTSQPFNGYFDQVVKETARKQPEYYFRLAEDFPPERSNIFYAVDNDKQVVNGLKAVTGHDKIKKEFLKARRFDRSMKYKIIGIYTLIGVAVAWLINSNN
jgi:hypothetical protein